MAKRCDLTGLGVMTGNNVSKSKLRTRREFLPNLKEITLRSEALNSDVTLRILASVLRTINKFGGLDSFLINYKFNKLTDSARTLRRKVEKALMATDNYKNVKKVKKSNSTKKEKVSKRQSKKVKKD